MLHKKERARHKVLTIFPIICMTYLGVGSGLNENTQAALLAIVVLLALAVIEIMQQRIQQYQDRIEWFEERLQITNRR